MGKTRVERRLWTCLQQHLCHVNSSCSCIYSSQWHSQPMPSQRNPGKQQPPFGASGQDEYPLLVSQLILPEHVDPRGQHPTDPTPGLLFTFMQVLPVPQQTSGAPIEEQLLVPAGHANCLLANAARIRIRERKSSSASGRRGDCASHVLFP